VNVGDDIGLLDFITDGIVYW